ncbi:restriction endonuclease subunit S [Vibrio breoganii]|uniref:restriction endonuclease subunit S n=1 Tax=Vibrio breoganii TaxID=553239 RepID=UPI000C865781|nr:restriction endonuclease subunit S [Vibrio breoganii]PMH16945.1 restriction endonuclease subunit S [Vibrio breoganii]PMM14875.1 restriction endonuclease subunit S [Vibrio breoganii]
MSLEQLITDNIDTWTSTVKTKATTGRGSSKKLELYGVKKLRELILELAVRGKLVPQDPNDEPASVLLERIAEEKAQMVKEKKISKVKKRSALTEQEKATELPNGWAVCHFGDLYHLEYGDNLPKAKRSESGEYPVYGSNGIVGTHNELSVDGPCVVVGRKGSAGALNISSRPCWVTDVAYSVIPPVGITLNYCFLHLSTFGLDSLGKGIKPGLNRNEANVLVVCLPPTEEQHRIVAKVDELMTLCDQLEQQTEASIEAHQVLVTTLLDTLTNSADADELMQNWARISEHFDTLFTTEASIDQLKQTILQLAVMGKLVPQDPTDEPAAKLLERIAEEKAQLIKEKKIKKQKALPPIADNEKPFELPNGWEWARLGSLMNLISGQHLKPSEYSEEPLENGNPYITGPAEFGPVYPSFSKYTNETRALADVGDILITCKGAGLGKLNITNQTLAISRQLMAIQSICVVQKFLFAVLDSKYDYFQSKGVGIAIPGISREDVTDLIVALPPITEQDQIVARVNELFILCEQLKVGLKNSQTTQLHLTDAIVDQAV